MSVRNGVAPAAVRRSLEQNQIPGEELRRLALRLADARDYAERGKVGLGYTLLLRGFLHAEQCLLAGHPWAGELVRCWRDTIDHYCERYDSQHEEA